MKTALEIWDELAYMHDFQQRISFTAEHYHKQFESPKQVPESAEEENGFPLPVVLYSGYYYTGKEENGVKEIAFDPTRIQKTNSEDYAEGVNRIRGELKSKPESAVTEGEIEKVLKRYEDHANKLMEKHSDIGNLEMLDEYGSARYHLEQNMGVAFLKLIEEIRKVMQPKQVEPVGEEPMFNTAFYTKLKEGKNPPQIGSIKFGGAEDLLK